MLEDAPSVREMAYLVRTSQMRFADVPAEQRKAVATAMARLSSAEMQSIAEGRRFPRGGGHGSFHSSRVS